MSTPFTPFSTTLVNAPDDGEYYSQPGTPESHHTGEGGSLPASPTPMYEELLPERRAHSVDTALDRRRKAVAGINSHTSGVVDSSNSKEAKEKDMGPHPPFGTMEIPEAYEVLRTHERLWFPLPIAWREIPELQGTAIYFNKYPSRFDHTMFPRIENIREMEPAIKDKTLDSCRQNLRRIGYKLLSTLRATKVPADALGLTETECKIEVQEVPPVNPFPSHVLIIEQDPPVKGERCRTFVPIHDVMFLAFVGGVTLPPRVEPNPVQKGDRIEVNVRIARFGVPHPAIFERILLWMYGGHNDRTHMAFFDQHLGFAGLPENARMEASVNLPRLLRLPFLKEDQREAWTSWSRQIEARMAGQWAMTYCYERLITLMKDANLQYENIIALQFHDNVLEAAILLCRRLLLSAMCFSVVRDHL
ncbi:hypothetical protein FRC16_002666, partial [Serendipita sp. 398]